MFDIIPGSPKFDRQIIQHKGVEYELPFNFLSRHYRALREYVKTILESYRSQYIEMRNQMLEALNNNPKLSQSAENNIKIHVQKAMDGVNNAIDSIGLVKQSLKFPAYQRLFHSMTECLSYRYWMETDDVDEIMSYEKRKYEQIWKETIQAHLMQIKNLLSSLPANIEKLKNFVEKFATEIKEIFTENELNAGMNESIKAPHDLDKRKLEFYEIIKTQQNAFKSNANALDMVNAIKDIYGEIIGTEDKLNDIITNLGNDRTVDLMPKHEKFANEHKHVFVMDFPTNEMMDTFEITRNAIIRVVDDSWTEVNSFTTNDNFKCMLGAIKLMKSNVSISKSRVNNLKMLLSDIRGMQQQISILKKKLNIEQLAEEIEDARTETRAFYEFANQPFDETQFTEQIINIMYSDARNLVTSQYDDVLAAVPLLSQCKNTINGLMMAHHFSMSEVANILRININDTGMAVRTTVEDLYTGLSPREEKSMLRKLFELCDCGKIGEHVCMDSS